MSQDNTSSTKTQVLKAFVEVDSLQNNALNAISPIGELSTWAMTYTKNRQEYSNDTFPGLRLVTFSCLDSVDGEVAPSQTIVQETLQIAQYAMVYAGTHTLPYDQDNYEQWMAAKAINIANKVKTGLLVSNGTIALPEWISWSSLEEDGTSVKIWLSDEAFTAQYDLFEITVIPPLSTLDDFFKTPNEVKTELAAVSISQMMDNIQAAKVRNPETYTRSYNFNYVSPVLGQDPSLTNWSVLIYGMHGDNIDSVKEALQNFIMANTTHSRSDWETIFPDIFKNTEFVILPRWDQMAIPDFAIQTGIYASVVTPAETVQFAQKNIPFYDPAWIANNVVAIPYPYKSLTLDIVTGPTNAAGETSFSSIFSDYIPVGTTSLDFNRMTTKTQEWILFIEKMLIVAENFSNYLTIEDPIRVISRGDITYLSVYYENVEYLVALKGSYVN